MPDWKKLVRERIAPLRMEATAESDLVEEVAQHLEDCYRETLSGGAGEDKAYRRAMSELDDMHPLKAGIEKRQYMPSIDAVPAGDAMAGNFLEDFWRDARYAVRTMRKGPLFVLSVVLTLGLGIGANSTVFTLINTLILNPLPVPDSGGLLAIAGAAEGNASKMSPPLPISRADLKDYQSRNEVFSKMAGYTSPRLLTWQRDGGAERVFCEFVTGSYFSTLGIEPARGRFFSPEEDGASGAHPVVVMNYATWQGRFGGSPDILGKKLSLNNAVVTVIGIAPPQFIGVNGIFGPDLWIPAAMSEQLLPYEMQNALTDRGKANFRGLARLKPGITRAQAQANLSTISAALAHEYPDTNQGHTATVLPIRDVLFASGSTSSSPILFGSAVLLIVVGIVLLIACSNAANLLLARSAARQQEMAVRLAMGASRARLVRQLLTESVFLGILSGMMGLFFAFASLRLLWSLPTGSNFIVLKFDATVFAFTLVVSLVTGLLFGCIPAFKASRSSVVDALKQGLATSGTSPRKVTLANALLVGQVAFSFLLLVTAALFLRSIGRAYQMDTGFQTAHLAVFMTNPGQAGYGKAQSKAFYKDARDRVERLPGIASASWASNLPLWARTVSPLQVEGHEQRFQADNISTVVDNVDTGYFETAGVAILRGRGFTNVDQENSAPVTIVNEKLAHDFWPSGDALGKRIQLPDEKQMRQIVGIARNANYTAIGEAPQPCVYVPMEQKYSDAMTLYVRTMADPNQMLIPVQRELAAAGPRTVVSDFTSGARTGRTIVDGGLFQARVGVALLSVFGLLALSLASVGLYGIMAYSVSQRKREIGLRMALGAMQGNVLRLVLRQGMSLVLTGVLIGFVAALLVGQLLSRMLYGVSAEDPISVGGAALVLSTVALLACYLPARRASRIDPCVALREG